MNKILPVFSLLFSASTLLGVAPHAYITDQKGTTVQVIDVTQNTTQTIFGFDHPRVVKISSDGTTAFVGEDTGDIYAIDTLTHIVMPALANVHHPVAFALTPDNNFLYIASNNDTISVLRLSDNMVIATLSGFNDLEDIKVTPDGAFAYATNGGNGTVSVIRTSDNTLVDTISGMMTPVGLTFTNDGAYAYVTDTKKNLLSQIRTSDNTIVDTIYGFNVPRYLGMTIDDHFAYVSCTGDDSVKILRLSDNKILESVPVAAPASIAFTVDGLNYYVGSKKGVVYKISVLGNVVEAVLPGVLNPSNIALTNDNAPETTVNGCRVTGDEIHVTWGPVPGSPVAFKVYQDAGFTQPLATLPGSATDFNHTGLVAAQTYWYYVVAVYSSGFSATIGSVEVRPVRVCLSNI